MVWTVVRATEDFGYTTRTSLNSRLSLGYVITNKVLHHSNQASGDNPKDQTQSRRTRVALSRFVRETRVYPDIASHLIQLPSRVTKSLICALTLPFVSSLQGRGRLTDPPIISRGNPTSPPCHSHWDRFWKGGESGYDWWALHTLINPILPKKV